MDHTYIVYGSYVQKCYMIVTASSEEYAIDKAIDIGLDGWIMDGKPEERDIEPTEVDTYLGENE